PRSVRVAWLWLSFAPSKTPRIPRGAGLAARVRRTASCAAREADDRGGAGAFALAAAFLPFAGALVCFDAFLLFGALPLLAALAFDFDLRAPFFLPAAGRGCFEGDFGFVAVVGVLAAGVVVVGTSVTVGG